MLDPATLYLQKRFLDGMNCRSIPRNTSTDFRFLFPDANRKPITKPSLPGPAPWLSEAAKLRVKSRKPALRKVSDGQHDQARTLLSQTIEHFAKLPISVVPMDLYRLHFRVPIWILRIWIAYKASHKSRILKKRKPLPKNHHRPTQRDASGYLEKTRILYF